LKDLGSTEKDVLLEMAFGKLLSKFIFGNGLLDLWDGFTSHNRLISDTPSTQYQNITGYKANACVLLFGVGIGGVHNFLGHHVGEWDEFG
jgi:hypothetical protein